MYRVNDGFSFVTKRGLLKSGDEIKQEDFYDAETFKKNVKTGKIVEDKPVKNTAPQASVPPKPEKKTE
jgi:hypothetical protein